MTNKALILLSALVFSTTAQAHTAHSAEFNFPASETLYLCADEPKAQIISLDLKKPSPQHRPDEWQSATFMWIKRDEPTTYINIAKDKVKLLPWNTMGEIAYYAVEFSHQGKHYHFFSQAHTQSDEPTDHDKTGLIITDKDGNKHTHLCPTGENSLITNRLNDDLDLFLHAPSNKPTGQPTQKP